MKGRPVFRKAGMTVREYPTGEDAVFDLGFTSVYAFSTSVGIARPGAPLIEESD